MQTIIHIGWMNSNIYSSIYLLYSIGDYIQYPVMNHNGKEHGKKYIYMYKKTESLCHIAEIKDIINQLYFNKM